jgi:AcrR family transcriptional regulator
MQEHEMSAPMSVPISAQETIELADAPASPRRDCPQKESQIVNGAAQVFAADGYEGASMSRIAMEAGVSKGTLYNYFTSKADLFAAYMHRDCSRWIALVFEDMDLTSPPDETMRRIGRRMFTMLLSEPSLVMYRMVVAEAEKFPELARTFYAEGPARAIAHVSTYLARMTLDGRLRVEHPEFAAEQFFALIQTQLCMKRRLRLIDMPSEAQIDHVVECAVHLFMSGYGVKPGA